MFGFYKKKKDAVKAVINPMHGKGMKLVEAEVDILCIVRDNSVIYTNEKCDNLFLIDKDGDKKLDGKVVNYKFTSLSDNSTIEVFVAFDDSDSYTLFVLQIGNEDRLNYVSQAIFNYFMEKGVQNLFVLGDKYNAQYIYSFNAYKKNDQYLFVNTARAQGYLIGKKSIVRENVDEMKRAFWK